MTSALRGHARRNGPNAYVIDPRWAEGIAAGLVVMRRRGWQPLGVDGRPLLTLAEAEEQALAVRRRFPENARAIGLDANDPNRRPRPRTRLRNALKAFAAESSFGAAWNNRTLVDAPTVLDVQPAFNSDGELGTVRCHLLTRVTSSPSPSHYTLGGSWPEAEWRRAQRVLLDHGFAAALVLSPTNGDVTLVVHADGWAPVPLTYAEHGVFVGVGAGRRPLAELHRFAAAAGLPQAGRPQVALRANLTQTELTPEEIAAWREHAGQPLPQVQSVGLPLPPELMRLSVPRVWGRCEPSTFHSRDLRFTDAHGQGWLLEITDGRLVLASTTTGPGEPARAGRVQLDVADVALFARLTGIAAALRAWLAERGESDVDAASLAAAIASTPAR